MSVNLYFFSVIQEKFEKQFLLLIMPLEDFDTVSDIANQLKLHDSYTVNTKDPENLKNLLYSSLNLVVSYEPVTEMVEEEGMNAEVPVADTYNFILEKK